MKRNLVYLVALMFLLATAISFAGDTKETTSSGKTCAQICAEKAKAAGDAGKAGDAHACCPMMNKADAKVEGAVSTDPAAASAAGGCPMMKYASAKVEATSAGTPTPTAKAGDTKATGGCPMMNKVSAETPKPSSETATAQPTTAVKEGATATSVTAEPKIGETCPDVSSKAALSNFHEVMSPMHMAFEDNKYDEMKSSMPKLIEVSKGIASYKCPMSDKCSPDCLKKFDERKSALLKGVDDLDLAFKGNDNKKVDSAFMTMHQAFVDFAGMCNTDTKATDTKAIETKAVEETK